MITHNMLSRSKAIFPGLHLNSTINFVIMGYELVQLQTRALLRVSDHP